MVRGTIIVVLILLGVNFAFANDQIPRSVSEYSRLLEEVKTKKNLSLQTAYEAGIKASDDLAEGLGYDASEIDPLFLKTVREKMEGFNITPNTEIEVISPNLDYFLHLAEIQGVPEDLLFFRLYLKSITANRRWPIYVQNDDGEFLGCTIYDGTLTRLHKSWSEYQKAHPGFYVSEIRKNIDDIEFHLTESRCACPTKNKPILKELESFARDYPNLKVTLKIRNRIKEIKNKKGPSLGCENLG